MLFICVGFIDVIRNYFLDMSLGIVFNWIVGLLWKNLIKKGIEKDLKRGKKRDVEYVGDKNKENY